MINIYIVTHKPVDLSSYNLDKCYKVIRVGNYAQENSDLLSDNTGENISKRNSNYCELTAYYWIWKNDTSDVVGLVHYRRFFTKALIDNSPRHFLRENDVRKILEKFDAIVARKSIITEGAYVKYLRCGYAKDLDHVKEAIRILCPEYLPYYNKYFEYSAGFRPFNMIITRKEIFDSYCEWLFKILEYTESKTDLSGYTPQEKRIYGYISERLLDVWLEANQIKCKSMKVINTDEKFNLKYILRNTKLWKWIKLVRFHLKMKSREADVENIK